MSRLSRLQPTFLLITISFMSYLGLICQVQVLMPAHQRQSQQDAVPLLDYEQTSALQRRAAEDGLHVRSTNTDAPGKNKTLDHAPELDTFQDVHREQKKGLYNYSVNWFDGDGQNASQSRHRAVSFIPLGNMFVFGAYLDLRKRGQRTVRILVLQRRTERESIVCMIHNHTLHALPYRMCEGHGKEYEGWIYSYTVPNTMPILPHQVSVSPFNQTHTHTKQTLTLNLKMIPPQAERQATNIGVCVPPVFGHLNLASLVNFIQMCKVLGADKVFMYMGGVSSEIKQFLIHHSNKDAASLSAIDWTLPHAVSKFRDKLWYHGQLLAIQDCLYHNMASVRFLLFMDLDEMLVPRLTRNWPDMLTRIFAERDRRSVAALTFRSVFFDPTGVPQDSENIVYFQHIQRTASVSQVRNKVMVQPMKVFELGIHHLSKALSEEFHSVEVSPTVALLHHYRACEGRHEPDMKCDLVTEDRTMLRYKNRLTHLSRRVITDVSKLFA